SPHRVRSGTDYREAYNTGGVPQLPLDSPGTLRPRLRLPCSPGAFLCRRPLGRAMRCTVLGFTSNLAAVLRTLMPPARAALICSANLSAIRLPAEAFTFTL